MPQAEQNWKTFNIDNSIKQKYPELIKMVLATESMDNDERQYWFDIMPSMTEDQINRLFNILDTEKKKLDAIEQKFQSDIKQLNEKHLIEWQEFQIKDSKKKIAKKEAAETDESAEDVLKMLNNL